MKNDEAVQIIKAMSAGCSPVTGEVLPETHFLKDKEVQQALQLALGALKGSFTARFQEELQLKDETIEIAIAKFKAIKIMATPYNIACFLGGVRNSYYEKLQHDALFGILKNKAKLYSLQHFMLIYFQERFDYKPKEETEAWRSIDFFDQPVFCHLQPQAITNLENRIKQIELVKRHNITEKLQEIRKTYGRSHEPWSEYEKSLLNKALKYTNDLDLLSHCFQRGANSIKIYGQQLLYEEALLNAEQ